MWTLNEMSSGARVSSGKTQKEAILNFIRYLAEHDITNAMLHKQIRARIREAGLAPASPRTGYYYLTVRTSWWGSKYRRVLVKGKPVVIPGWEHFKFFLHKDGGAPAMLMPSMAKKDLGGRLSAMMREAERTAKRLRETTGQRFIPVPEGYWAIILELRAFAKRHGWHTRKRDDQICFYPPNYPARYRTCVLVARPGYAIYPSYIRDLKFVYEEIAR